MTDMPAPDSTPEARPLGQSLAAGAAYLKEQLTRLPDAPGVYRMLNRKGDPLYVGKARSLRKRIANYANPTKLPDRLRRMVAETTLLEVVTTHTEVEALLLEAHEILANSEGEQRQTRRVVANLVSLYEAWGKPDRANEWRVNTPAPVLDISDAR